MGDVMSIIIVDELPLTGYTAEMLDNSGAEGVCIADARRYYVADDVIVTKPKQPNFARFQNNFKRRGQ